MGRTLDIGVTGCGPAGMAAAVMLARQGHRVRIFDRFPAPKPVGSGLMLQPTGLAVLREMGLVDRIVARGSRIDRLFGQCALTGRVVLSVRYDALDAGYAGLGVHRAALFGVLADALAAEGLAVEPDTELTRVERSGSTMRLFSNWGPVGDFDLVVDALGSRSPLMAASGLSSAVRELPYGALWTNLPMPEDFSRLFAGNALEQRYVRSSVMVGVLPVGVSQEGTPPLVAFFWSMKPADHESWKADGLDAWKSRILSLWPATEGLLAGIRHPEEIVLARYCHHTARGLVAPGYAAVGDSGHAASPQLGQGANMALLDAWALAQAIERRADLSDALRDYEKARRRSILFFQSLSAAFTPFYQSDARVLPMIRDRLAAPLSTLPPVDRILAAMVGGTLGWSLSPLGLVPHRLVDRSSVD